MPDINLNSLGSLKTLFPSSEPKSTDTGTTTASTNSSPLWLAAIEAMKNTPDTSGPKKKGMPMPPGIGSVPVTVAPAVAVLPTVEAVAEKQPEPKAAGKSGPKISLSGLGIGSVAPKPVVSVPAEAPVQTLTEVATSSSGRSTLMSTAPAAPIAALSVSPSVPAPSPAQPVVSTSIFSQSSAVPITKSASASVSLASFVQSGQEMDAGEALKSVQAASASAASPSASPSVSLLVETAPVSSPAQPSSTSTPASAPAPVDASGSSIAIDLSSSDSKTEHNEEVFTGVAELFPNFSVVDKDLEADIEMIETEERAGGKPKKASAFSMLKKTFSRSEEASSSPDQENQESVSAIASESNASDANEGVAMIGESNSDAPPLAVLEGAEAPVAIEGGVAVSIDSVELQPVMSEAGQSDSSETAPETTGLNAERASEADTMKKAREWMQQWFNTVRPGSIEKVAEASAARRKKIMYTAIPIVLLSASAITAFNFLDHSGQKPTISVVENQGKPPIETPVATDTQPKQDPTPVSQEPVTPVLVASPVIETPITNTKTNPGTREFRLQAWIDAGLAETEFNALLIRRTAEWQYYVPATTIAEYANK